MDPIVREFATRFVLRDYFARNADALRAMDARNTASMGPVPLFADLSRATPEKVSQFVIHEATLALTHESVALFDTNVSFDHAFASVDSASRMLAHLPKLVNVPVPLTTEPLIVVHAHEVFDPERTAKAGIDREVAARKARGLPVVYLMTDEGDADLGWYAEDREPTYAVYSQGGEHNLPIRTDTLELIGGFFGDQTDDNHGCHFRAMMDAISRHTAFTTSHTFTIVSFLNGTTSTTDFASYVADLFFPEEGQPYLGSELQSEGAGQLTTHAYRFELLVDGQSAHAPIGDANAPNTVRFDFRRPPH
jgi:hypothetical protein